MLCKILNVECYRDDDMIDEETYEKLKTDVDDLLL